MLLDQPEDDLDNRFVVDHLVGGVREAKNRRQVFIVTHNANVPVLAGAEQVIECNFIEGRVQLRALGSVDAPECASAISQVLEGSAEAFGAAPTSTASSNGTATR